jgi:RNA-directed DNA polymerase
MTEPTEGHTVISTKLEVAKILAVAPGEIDYVMSRLPRFYEFRSEPKPNGGERIFFIPRGKLRRIQDKIKTQILDGATFPKYLHGGIKKRSALTNVSGHERREAVLALDVKNFFPSIRPERVTRVFERLGYSGEAARVLTRLTTYENQLPQGPPTSPAIANLCIPRADARLSGLARTQNLEHSRLMDDMTLSGSRRLGKFRRLAARIIEEEGFSVKQGAKGKLMLQSERQVVTGVALNFKKNVPRDRRQATLKEVVQLLKAGSPVDDRTRGKLAWVTSANPRAARRVARAAKKKGAAATA